MEEFKALVIEKDEFGYRDMSVLKALLPVLADQGSDSNVGNKFIDILKQVVLLY